MRLTFEIDDQELKKIIVNELERKSGIEVKPENVRIVVKSKQNFKSEWEDAAFKATFTGDV